MSNRRVGWEGWAIGLIAVVGVPIGLLFIPVVGGIVGTTHGRYPRLSVSAPPINPVRLAIGLVIAAVFVMAAAWIIHKTDWETPTQTDDR
ncbi:MAG: hypothetical protein OEY55_13330 [Acidimicrobiia bacterium]|nr:hypothetical protein [Acidimicrobiia bacterium]MDH5504348.1 hypothetical protein [Acidimicrobiia bacterium]